jgi:hypothetical protein
MASLTTICQKFLEKKRAMNLARSIYDLASRTRADEDTKSFLWNKYIGIQNIVNQIEKILKEVGFATIELQRAVEWSSVGVYKAQFLETLGLIYPDCSEEVFTLFHQEAVDKATNDRDIIVERLTKLLARAEPYLAI